MSPAVRLTYEIEVEIANNTIGVDTPIMKLAPGERVRWVSKNGKEFTIVFHGTSPFDEKVLIYEQATTSRPAKNKKSGAGHKYCIYSDDNPNVWLDPAIIVEDP